ncbi:MAG: phosphate acyltransferase PlsX [Sphingobacteriia bacterium]|nr:MAG: phosphate acyltransferase PlsX [Sphingobacteriia bacterium]
MNIGIDMMGGDFAPLAAVKGLQQFLQDTGVNAQLYAIGDEKTLSALLAEEGLSSPFLHVVHAPDTIGYHEHPTKALKEKPQSSIAVGFQLLAQNKIDAFISAGNTGAMLVGAMFSIKPSPGVLRPSIATIMPKLKGGTGVLLDVGLNADCKPEHLEQFARLGSLYAQHILGIDQPKVGLVNVGEEEGKGNILAQATYPLLKAQTALQFVGNIEGRDFFADKADVMVCDGFTGNIVLKMAESVYDAAVQRGQAEDDFFGRFHYENYGGTPVLGVNKPVIIGHGISSAKAFSNMVSLAVKMVETQFCENLAKAFAAPTA